MNEERTFLKFSLRFGAKLAIVGGAVYITVNNSVWDKSEYANKAIGKVKEALPETTEMLKDVFKVEKKAKNF